MKLRKELELVGVEYSSDAKKVSLTFLDRDEKAVRVVNFNKQIYVNGKYVDDAEKAEKVDGWCEEYFNLKFKDLEKALGVKRDIYVYEKFNSLWECSEIQKFSLDDVGQIYQTKIKEVIDDGVAIRVRYDIDGATYESKMTYATYLEATKEWFEDPIKKRTQYEKFKDKFNCEVENADTLIGHDLMVEVKKAFKFAYGDMKKFPNK